MERKTLLDSGAMVVCAAQGDDIRRASEKGCGVTGNPARGRDRLDRLRRLVGKPGFVRVWLSPQDILDLLAAWDERR